jgi:putative transposase
MSRPLRSNVVGGWYHVTSRGHNRRAIFLDDGDRRHFLSLLESMIEMHRVEVHGYVLMDNHYHLLVCTPEANLSEAIQWLNVSYSVWWNRRHQQCGSLYQGRFKAVLVEGGGWLLRLSQYIHYNPVAIQGLGMGKQEKAAEQKGWRKPTREEAQRRMSVLREYEWSSYRAYAGYEKAVGWLSTATILRRVKGGRDGYREMTESHLLCGHDEDFWAALKWGFVLGGTKFAESIRAGLKIDRETSGQGIG